MWRVVASSNETTPFIVRNDSVITSLQASVPGVYGVELTVSDGATQSTDYVVIHVAGNQAPVADASRSDRFAEQGKSFSLDGTASFDPDGDGLTYAWQLLSAPEGAEVHIAQPSGAITDAQASISGNFLFKLIVNDGQAQTNAFHLAKISPPAVTNQLLGDADSDGKVAFADFLILSQNFGAVDATYAMGDFDGSKVVDFADFLMLSANFGRTS